MRAHRSLAAIATAATALSLAACSREKPWHDPLGARMAHAIYQPGSSLALRPGPGPEAELALYASYPAATYNPYQASAGKQLYDSTCARCHPPGHLDGANFSDLWKNRRVFDLFAFLSNTMPQNRPGSLTDSQYVNVIAYLLQRNQASSGAGITMGNLTTDTASMKKERIDIGGPPGPTGVMGSGSK